MSTQCLLALFSACFLAACAKKEAPASATSPTAEQAQAAAAPSEQEQKIEAQFVPPPNAKPDAPVQERLNGAVHPGLTMMLQAFIQAKGRMPASIQEFAYTTMDSMPAVPPGMKYQIDPADKTVKLVRKTE
jgi:hypothetical protein